MKSSSFHKRIALATIFMHLASFQTLYGVEVTAHSPSPRTDTASGETLSKTVTFSPDMVPVQIKTPMETTTVDLKNPNVKRLTLVEGRSHLLKFLDRIRRLSVSNPDIIDFLTLSSSEVLLNAKKQGSVNIMVWGLGNELVTFDINVIRDPGVLDQLLGEIDPGGHFEIFPSRDVFVVKGEATSVRKMELVQQAVENFARGSVSLVRVKNVKQVLLQTRFVQVDLSRTHNLGMDVENYRGPTKTSSANVLQRFLPGSTTAATGGTTTIGGMAVDTFSTNDSDMYQLIYSNSNKQYLSAFIKALESDGLGKTIARPNLLAKDGEKASFLVGGETAILVTTNDQISVQYKEFGTKLDFMPQIMDDGEIKLEIEPSVSVVNSNNGVSVGTNTVPGFSTTRVKTVVQLKNNETLMIGGLIQQQLTTQDVGVPFMKRIPILGKLFQSTYRKWNETELLIIVTPRIINPERSPIRDDQEKDNLAQATKLIPPYIPIDDQAEAVKNYVQDTKRWGDLDDLEKELKDLESLPASKKSKAKLGKKPVALKKEETLVFAKKQTAKTPVAATKSSAKKRS